MTMVDCWTIKFQFEARRFSGKEALPMYAQKLLFIMHPLCTLCVTFIMHTVHTVSKYNRVIVSIL